MAVSGDSSPPSVGLSSKTPILGQRLYVVIVVTVATVVIILVLIFLCLRFNRNSKRRKMRVKHSSGLLPLVCKEIIQINDSDQNRSEICPTITVLGKEEKKGVRGVLEVVKKGVEEEVDGRVGNSGSNESGTSRSDASSSVSAAGEGMNDLGWGRWYNFKELEMATKGFAEGSVVGEGGYGVVYRGVLPDGSVIAVKNLLNNK